MITTPKRRWFRFSIRDLLWLTAVVALAVAWWLDRSTLASITAAKKELEIRVRQIEYNRDGFRSSYIELMRIMEELAAKPENAELKRRLDELTASSTGN